MVNGGLPNEGGSKANRSCCPLARRNDCGGGGGPCSRSCGTVCRARSVASPDIAFLTMKIVQILGKLVEDLSPT
jgi:hypothetical protein